MYEDLKKICDPDKLSHPNECLLVTCNVEAAAAASTAMYDASLSVISVAHFDFLLISYSFVASLDIYWLQDIFHIIKFK